MADYGEIFGGAASGAATGAAIGSMFPGYGTAIGGGAGALLGGVQGIFRGRAKKRQQDAVGQARLQLEQLGRDQRQQRQMDLDKALSFYAPVQGEMRRLYGSGV